MRVASAVDQGKHVPGMSIPTGKAHLPADRIGNARTLASTRWVLDPTWRRHCAWLSDAGSLPLFAAVDGGTGPAAPRSVRARILWADDNTDMRDYVRRLLSPHYEVEAVADGQAALAAARARRPDLVLADVMMPKLDGFGLLRAAGDPRDQRAAGHPAVGARGEEARVEGLRGGHGRVTSSSPSARASCWQPWRTGLGWGRASAQAEAANPGQATSSWPRSPTSCVPP